MTDNKGENMKQTAYTVGELIEVLKTFDAENRLSINCECSFDFGIDIRQSQNLMCTVELGDSEMWQELDDEDK